MAKHKRGKKSTDTMSVHTGELLWQKMKEQKIAKTTLAAKTGRADSAIFPILKRPSVQAYVLWEISEAMGYNFFHEIAEALDEQTKYTLANGKKKEKQKITELEQENEKLKLEVGILKEVLKGNK
jgi:hypothetical protein